MAVVTRKDTKGRPIYWIAFTWNGKRVWERSGGDRRAADKLETQRKREVKAKTYVPKSESKATTLGQWGKDWAAKRPGRNADDERAALSRYVFSRAWLADLPICDVKPKHMVQLVAELKATISEETERPLSTKSVANIYGIVHTLMRDAFTAEVTQANPCVLPRGTFPKKGSSRSIYAEGDIITMVTDERLSLAQRVWDAIAFFTGMRQGEVCGLRWSDYDLGPTPLASLNVERQYDGQLLKTEKAEEGEQPRRVPVHPVLRSILDAWKASGFELTFLRKPRAEDPIVPRNGLAHHTKSTSYKAWVRACDTVGVIHRTLHSTRHTFITKCRRGGGREDVVERITHNAKGSIVDVYTHWEWDPLCEAMMCLRIGEGSPPALPPAPESAPDTVPELPSIDQSGGEFVQCEFADPLTETLTESPPEPEPSVSSGFDSRRLHNSLENSKDSTGTGASHGQPETGDSGRRAAECDANQQLAHALVLVTADRDAWREAWHRQREATGRMALEVAPYSGTPTRGQIINARATAGARLVAARELVRRMPAHTEAARLAVEAVGAAERAYESALEAERRAA